jgi:hypothetical protein
MGGQRQADGAMFCFFLFFFLLVSGFGFLVSGFWFLVLGPVELVDAG